MSAKLTNAQMKEPMTLPPEVISLIEDEEDRLKQVMQSLQSQREIAKRRLKTESERAQDFTAQIVAARKDSDKQMLASDEAVSHGLRDRKREEIGEIDRLLERPYFARMVLHEKDGLSDKEIEFRLGTVSNPDCRIIDWRKAPISKLYYEYKEGEIYDEEIQGRERTGKIVVRNKLDIERGELKAISCRFGYFVRTAEGWQEGRGKMRTGASRRIGELPDVLSLITPEQFRAITQDAESAVVIQGIAGSGKTTVALHRLSWLLAGGNSDLESRDSLVLVRSRPLKTYIQQSLPSLDIGDVQTQTFQLWVRKLIEKLPSLKEKGVTFSDDDSPVSVERVLRSSALLKTIDDYVNGQRDRLIRHLETTFRDAAPFIQKLESIRGKNFPAIRMVEELHQSLRGLEQQPWFSRVSEELSNCRKRLSLYREDLARLFESPKALMERDQSKLIDENLLSEARDFLARERKSLKVSLSESVLILLLATAKGEVLKRPEGFAKKYRHIVVDEVQDFSVTELAFILNMVESLNQLTLTGDAAQAISASGSFPGWEALRKLRNLGDTSHFVELTVSHRSTQAIMRLADFVHGESRTTGGRQGKAPLWYSCRNENDGTRETIEWLLRVSEKYPEAVVAVLCESRERAKFVASLLSPTFSSALQLWDDSSQAFQEGVLVMSVHDAKGLEFEHVLIWNPSDAAYPRTRLGRNRLYVAITRAEEHLCLVTWDNPSSLLPPITGGLVRGVEAEEEEEDDGEVQLLDALPGEN